MIGVEIIDNATYPHESECDDNLKAYIRDLKKEYKRGYLEGYKARGDIIECL